EEKKKKKTAKKRLPSPSKAPPAPKRKQAKLSTPARGGAANRKGQEQNDGESSSEGENEFVENYENEDLLRMVIPPRPQPCMKSDGTGARLVIREIVATNFKSYFGTQRIGPFHKNFTAIIGPNGSGKSNVIDSLLFVFGYKASKIRSKKLSVLIHSSRGHDDINSCTVEVFFEQIVDKDGHFEVVEGSEFSVSRTAYKNNNSVYAWNGKTMSIKEIAGRLRGFGIDLVHNRFLILQGEVEQIAMMKPKGENAHEEGMLEYLEDIIGSSRFRVPIERLSARVDTLKEQRTNALQRVRVAEREKVALEGPVREMILYLKAENHAVLLRNQLFHIKLDQAKICADEKAARDEIGALERAAKARTNTMKRNVTDIARVGEEIEKEKQKVSLHSDLPCGFFILELQLEELKGVPAKAAARLEVNALRAKVSEDKQLVSSGIAGTERQKALGKAKAEGLLKGLIGRLGDLGTIDKKYDAAISTTTAALDSYVVETTNDGHEAIDYLVKRNLGRTNFIILDKTNEFKDRMDTKQKFPAPRLFDLIDIPDPRLRKVFYSTVFDTLVVDTLKEATELSRKDRSLRIVTLLGQVIDSSGTVSGGGAPKYGLMGNKEKGQAEKSMRDAQSRLPAMIKELDEKNEKLAETSAACRQMEQKIFALSNDANRLRAQFNACDNEILKLTERIAHMEKQVVYVSEQLEKNLADEAEVAAKKAEIEAATAEREECAKEVAAAKAKVDVVAAKVKSIFHEFVQKYLDEADTAKKRRQEIEEQAVKERVSIDLNEHNMEKVQNRIKFLEKQLADKKAKEQKLAEEEENLPKLLNQAKALQAEWKVKLEELEEFIKNTRQRREDFNRDELKYLKEVKVMLSPMHRRFERKEACLKGLKGETEKLRKQMDALTLHQTQEFDVVPKETRRFNIDDPMDDSLFGDLTLADRPQDKKDKKRDKKKGGDEPEEFLESPDGTVPKLTKEQVEGLDREHIKFTLTNIEQKQLSSRTDINMHVIHDYKTKV
ncbi:RecF/RecN/SMC protein, partial [Ancylostoma duodenale]